MPITRPPRLGEPRNGLHYRRKARNRAGAQVVAIGKAARNQDRVAAFQVVRLMPQVGDGLPHDAAEHVVRVVVAVGAGKDQNAEFHRSQNITWIS